jgi:YMGG-like Gly-zipper
MDGVPGFPQEEYMKRQEVGFASAGIAILAMALALGVASSAQEPGAPQQEQRPQVADGQRRGLPIETYAVAPGTKFLVKLEDELGTRGTAENAKFKVRTLEPLEAGSGIYLPPGAEIRGHISHVEPAGVAGRAKLWLTFDEIHTKFGVLPIVAEVVSVPGDHSVRPGPTKEGLIEGRSSTQQDAAESAAAGAAIGAVKGVKNKDKKEAAEGAALGALTAYLMESGRGHELNLPKGAKLELELERALYLVKE